MPFDFCRLPCKQPLPSRLLGASAAGKRSRTSKWDDKSAASSTTDWGKKWRAVVKAVLPKDGNGGVTCSDLEVQKLCLAMWKDLTSWAAEDCRQHLVLFQSDEQGRPELGIGSRCSLEDSGHISRHICTTIYVYICMHGCAKTHPVPSVRADLLSNISINFFLCGRRFRGNGMGLRPCVGSVALGRRGLSRLCGRGLCSAGRRRAHQVRLRRLVTMTCSHKLKGTT